LGHSVEISSVSLRFLPQPGFDLENFVVYDDPAFSAEPVLRAQEVTAVLRVTSLLRGRLEISRLSLSAPSLNLVRTNEGRWNFSSLVERAAKIPVAPTSKAKSEPRPGFPYIEASNGRINFKLGQEKKAYALMDADFSLWQDSENAWSMRLKAQPTRTNSNLSDTGILRAEGSWQRSATLGETPVNFNLQWENAQLGQFTKLATGTDRGWRGTILLTAVVTGTPADLSVTANASIQDFRRYDIAGGDALRLAAQCSAHYNSIEQNLTGLDCNSPVGGGALGLSGSIGSLNTYPVYQLLFNANDVPVPAGLALLQRAKLNVPDDLISTGRLNAEIKLDNRENSQQPVWQGNGTIQNARLLSRTNNADLIVDRIPFAITQEKPSKSLATPSPRIDIGPFHVALGPASTTNLRGWLSPSGYSLQIQGDARIKNLLQAARLTGLSFAHPAADGSAKVDLQIAGAWSGFHRADITGKVQLANVSAEISGVNAPLQISAASVTLRADDAIAQNVTASLGQSTWHGSLTIPRHCQQLNTCPIQFEFQTKELSGTQMAGLFISEARRPWYRFLSTPEASNSFLANLNATGTLSAGKLSIHQVNATQISAKVVWKGRLLQLTDLSGNVLGGNHIGEWSADFSDDTPQYSGHGSLQHAALGQLAQAMHDGWVTGTASASYQISASGTNAADFLASVRGSLDVDARETSLPHIMLTANAGPIFAKRFTGKILFRGNRLDIQEGKLETGGSIYQISGTALKGRGLNLRMLKDDVHGFTITGPLATPRVTTVGAPETQAELKQQ
ncbi:MAG TPA: AsmA family protein, partial [Candidatus Angelobacter sp.]